MVRSSEQTDFQNDVFDLTATHDFLSPPRFARFSICGAGCNAALLEKSPSASLAVCAVAVGLGRSRAQQNVIGRSMSKLRPWHA